ncbi:MAG: Cell wall-binding protein [Candidatus Falkowbacteria bacterium GW2011_GWF2_43_32]|nr:MAG: Cell wall-binding protein [Candidatus Falkowbacteria bacterium GW2011_GWF2_43_32]
MRFKKLFFSPAFLGLIVAVAVWAVGPQLSGPKAALAVDETGPTIQSVVATIGSPNLTVYFSENVQVGAGGAVAASNLTFTDNSGGAKTISSVVHTTGTASATVVLSDNVAAEDVDGTPSTLALKNTVLDMVDNAGATDALLLTSSVPSSNPSIVFTGPGAGMTNVPTGSAEGPFFVFFGLNQAMNADSITDTDATDGIHDNVYLTSDGTTKIAGAVRYYATTAACADTIANGGLEMPCPNGDNLGVFIPADALPSNSPITLIVTGAVRNAASQPVNGNYGNSYYSIPFSTGGGGCVGDDCLSGEGAFFPPFVMGSQPSGGAFNIPTNTLIVIRFSKPMNTGTLTGTNIKLYSLSLDGTATEVTGLTIGYNQTGDVVKISKSGGLTASTKYQLRVLGGVESQDNVPMNPGDTTGTAYMNDFQTGTGADTDAPTINNIFIPGCDTDWISCSIIPGTLDLFASESLDPDSVNGNSVTLKKTSDNTPVAGDVEYDPFSRAISFIPSVALSASTGYTLTANTAVTDLTSDAHALTLKTQAFTTGDGVADAALVPQIIGGIGNDFRIEADFNIPMNAVPNGTNSVVNKSNIAVKQGEKGTDVSGWAAVGLDSAMLSYDAMGRRLIIEGLTLTKIVNDFQLVLSNVKGLNGTDLPGTGTPPFNSLLGPIEEQMMDGMMGGGMVGSNTGFMPDSFSSDSFGYVPQGQAHPLNSLAGQTSIYNMNLPISKQIDAGGKIILTFPAGFTVAGAKQDVNSPSGADMNGPGSGTPTFKCLTAAGGTSCGGGATVTGDTADGGDAATRGALADDGIIVDSTARTITITLSAATNKVGEDEHDFLNLDVAGIVNSSIAKDWTTDGYTIGVKTKNAAGTVLEEITTSPFFISAGGSRTLTVTAEIGVGNDAAADTVNIYLGSPMTGKIEKATDAFNAAGTSHEATATFTNLSDGEYYIFTDPLVTLNSVDYVGINPPQQIRLSANLEYEITLNKDSVGTSPVVITVTGPANEPLDVFANNSSSFKVKEIILDGSGDGSTTLNLGDGNWFVGVGPQMPKGLASGMMTQPNYVIPRNLNVKVVAADTPKCTIEGTADDCELTFALTTADKSLKGTVTDESGTKAIANADIFAYDPQGGFGTFAQADANGKFTLNLVAGKYKVGANVQGMPSSRESSIEIIGSALYVDGTQTVADITAMANSDFKVILKKPGYTITGTVTDVNGNVVQNAGVWSYRTDGPGNTGTQTGVDGKYTLYVDNGAWKVGTYLPGYGPLPEQSVTIASASQANINFSPANTGETYRTISGTISVTGVGNIANAFVHAEGQVGGVYRFSDATTDANGAYSLTVPAGSFRLFAFHPDYGEFASQNTDATSANRTVNFTKGSQRIITFAIKDSTGAAKVVSEAFVDLFDNTNNFGNHTRIKNASGGTLSMPDGSYTIQANIPGIDGRQLVYTAADVNTTVVGNTLTVNGNEMVNITLPALFAISGNVSDGANPIDNVWVEIANRTTGARFGAIASTASNPDYTLSVPAGSYDIMPMKPGYVGAVETITVAAAATKNLTMTAADKTVTGSVLVGATGMADAFVRAVRTSDNLVVGTQAQADGTYTLNLIDGSWNISAIANGYQEANYASNPLTISANQAGVNITLTTVVTLKAPKSKPITPNQGGTVDAPEMGVKMTIPANALGSGSSAGTTNIRQTTNVMTTASAKPLGGKGIQITASDSNNTAITNLNDSVTLEITYTADELDTAFSDLDIASPTLAQVQALKFSYWDESNSSWVELPSTVVFSPDTATTYAELADNDEGWAVKIKGVTTHFSLFAPNLPTHAQAPDSAPTGLAAAASGSTGMTLTWTALDGATSYDLYRSTSSGGTYSRIGDEPTVASGATVTYDDSGLSAGATYYYKISALNDFGESAVSSAVSGATSSAGGGGGGVAAAPVCASVVYGDYAAGCFNGYQYRDVTSRAPANCTLTTAQQEATKKVCGTAEQATIPAVTVTGEGLTSGGSNTASFVALEKNLVKKINQTLAKRLVGRILLQVQEKGEAWYVNPLNLAKYYLGRPADAFGIMRGLGLGVSEKDYSSWNGKAPSRLAGRILA